MRPNFLFTLVLFFSLGGSLKAVVVSSSVSGGSTITSAPACTNSSLLNVENQAIAQLPYYIFKGLSSQYYPEAAAFIGQLYFDFLGRVPSESELYYWLYPLVSKRATFDAASFVPNITMSTEFLLKFVASYYQLLLKRTPTQTEEMPWVNQIIAGQPLGWMIASIAASQEFFADNGSTNTGYVTALYETLLQRLPDSSGLSFWVGELNSGAMSRYDVAVGFVGSGEYRLDYVTHWENILLGHGPAAGANWWNTGHLNLGQILVAIASSVEFVTCNGTYPPLPPGCSITANSNSLIAGQSAIFTIASTGGPVSNYSFVDPMGRYGTGVNVTQTSNTITIQMSTAGGDGTPGIQIQGSVSGPGSYGAEVSCDNVNTYTYYSNGVPQPNQVTGEADILFYNPFALKAQRTFGYDLSGVFAYGQPGSILSCPSGQCAVTFNGCSNPYTYDFGTCTATAAFPGGSAQFTFTFTPSINASEVASQGIGQLSVSPFPGPAWNGYLVFVGSGNASWASFPGTIFGTVLNSDGSMTLNTAWGEFLSGGGPSGKVTEHLYPQ